MLLHLTRIQNIRMYRQGLLSGKFGRKSEGGQTYIGSPASTNFINPNRSIIITLWRVISFGKELVACWTLKRLLRMQSMSRLLSFKREQSFVKTSPAPENAYSLSINVSLMVRSASY